MKNLPLVMVLSGYGLNCEEETKYAFELAGGKVDIVHINDCISNRNIFNRYQILAIPGGFSFGDDTGSGNAFAYKIKNHLWEELQKYLQKDHLVIGICNGFQILVNLGLLPGFEFCYGKPEVALLQNDSVRYIVRWTDIKNESDSPWLVGIDELSLPIAHGEGKFYAADAVLNKLRKKGMIALKYINGMICKYSFLPANPTGTLENIAAITDESKKILGIMPHPERAIFFTQLPNWPVLVQKYRWKKTKIPKYGPGIQIFQNAIKYYL